MIYLTGLESASIGDLLNDTRLSSIPYDGQLTIQMQASHNTLTNSYVCTISLPNGKVPVDAQRVMSGQTGDVSGGQLDLRYLTQWSFPAGQGGHFTIAITETGVALLTWRIALRP